MKNLYITIILSIVFSANIFSQSPSKNKFIDAEYYFLFDEYSKALPIYLSMYQKDSLNANINYRIALCYMNLVGQKYKAIPYLEKAVKDVTNNYKEGSYKEFKAPSEAFLYLGDAYRMNEQLDKAISAYNNFKKLLDPRDVFYVDIVKRQIESCIYAKELLFEPVGVEETSIGEPINTSFFEYNPVVNTKDDLIFFNQSKKTESILMSKKINGEWEKPKNITKNLKSDGFCKVVSISFDDKLLVVTNEFLEGGGDLFFAEIKNGKVGAMQAFNKKINSKYSETHGCFSADGNSFYFTSDRKGGFGGLDIYVSKKDEKGEWSDAENLGSTVNTKYNEDAPFILEDGKTLYFASEGHYSIGGFDYFVTTQSNDGFWSVPINLGYPINTTDDDIFYNPLKDGKVAYAHRIKNFGDGQSNIYKIVPAETTAPKDFTVQGNIEFDDGKIENYSKIKISLIGINSKDTTAVSFNPDSMGTYSQVLPIDDYKILVQADGYQSIAENIVIPKVLSKIEFNYDILLYPKTLASNLSAKNDSILTANNTEKKLTKKDILALYKNQKVSEFKIVYNVLNDSIYQVNNTENQLAINNQIIVNEEVKINTSTETPIETVQKVVADTVKQEVIAQNTVVEKVETKVEEPTKVEVKQEPVVEKIEPNVAVVEKIDTVKQEVIAQNTVVEKVETKVEEPVKIEVKQEPVVEKIEPQVAVVEKADTVKQEVIAQNTVVEKVETKVEEPAKVEVKQEPIVEKTELQVAVVEKVDTVKQEVIAQNTVVEKVETKVEEPAKVEVKQEPVVEKTEIKPVIAENKPIEKSTKNEVYVIKSLFFDYASANLNTASKTEIERLYLMMKNNPESKIEVTGHTDSKGNPEFNKVLSEKRAKAVVNYLATRGISKDRIITKALGEDSNIAINENPDGSDNPEGRQLNRRVEINIISTVQNNIVVENITVPDKLRYSADTKYYILVGEYENKLAENHFDKFKIKELTEAKTYPTKIGFAYVVGEYPNKANALKLYNGIVDLGFNDAKIINSFELNSLTEQAKNAQTTSNSTNVLTPNTFTVQISAIKTKAKFEKFNGIANVKEIKCNDGYFRYVVGEFKDNLEARTLRNEIAEKGFPDAFVIKSDAILSKAESSNKVETKTIETAVISNDGSFTIQVKASKAVMKKKEFNDYKNDVKEYVGKDGMYRYAVGNFATYEEAKKELQNILTDFNDAFVVKISSYNEK